MSGRSEEFPGTSINFAMNKKNKTPAAENYLHGDEDSWDDDLFSFEPDTVPTKATSTPRNHILGEKHKSLKKKTLRRTRIFSSVTAGPELNDSKHKSDADNDSLLGVAPLNTSGPKPGYKTGVDNNEFAGEFVGTDACAEFFLSYGTPSRRLSLKRQSKAKALFQKTLNQKKKPKKLMSPTNTTNTVKSKLGTGHEICNNVPGFFPVTALSYQSKMETQQAQKPSASTSDFQTFPCTSSSKPTSTSKSTLVLTTSGTTPTMTVKEQSFGIYDDILSQLVMDDSWVETTTSKPPTTVSAPAMFTNVPTTSNAQTAPIQKLKSKTSGNSTINSVIGRVEPKTSSSVMSHQTSQKPLQKNVSMAQSPPQTRAYTAIHEPFEPVDKKQVLKFFSGQTCNAKASVSNSSRSYQTHKLPNQNVFNPFAAKPKPATKNVGSENSKNRSNPSSQNSSQCSNKSQCTAEEIERKRQEALQRKRQKLIRNKQVR
ncbi:unnamed protein product [Clavelina lepadiformis]|uniref:Uncharacterized protein n=1 Tax=Clavelina lepadiformis TaxID=159417 RepID=A0ABP0FI63_CLALP